MSKDTLSWAVFVAVLVPLFLRQPAEPLAVTAAHLAISFGLVALADRIERRA